MPLDRERGERHKVHGFPDIVAPNAKWRESMFFEAAREDAVRAYRKAAKDNRSYAHPHIDDQEWMAQEYHRQGRIIFYFQKRMLRRTNRVTDGGTYETFYHSVPIALPSVELNELMLRGMWPPTIITREIGMRDILLRGQAFHG